MVSGIVIIALLILLTTREVISVDSTEFARRITRFLTIPIIPLLILLVLILIQRVNELIPG